MKKQITSWLLVLVLCLGLTVPAAAAEEKVTVGDKAYETVLDAILSEKEDKPVTVALSGDVALTAAVVLGESKVDDKTVTVASHNVTVDLNGYTLTGAKDSAVFEVQEGYTLTIVDNSEAKTGKLVSDAEEAVVVAEGATYNALPAGEEETPVEPEKPVNPFTDVAETSAYYEGILWAVEKGITTGRTETTFVPGEDCTEANILTFLWRAAGSPEPETRAMPFNDVPVGSYYYDAVLWAVENGITKGTSDTTFSPNMICTRAQIVVFLWRSEKSPAAGTANPFADVKSTAYYADAVLWAVKENITKGTTSTTFSPNADCTRAQIVTFLWRCKK